MWGANKAISRARSGMIGAAARIPIMTLLKILATVLAAGLFTLLGGPGFAANANDGVSTGAPGNPGDPATQPRRHRKHSHRHHRRHRDGNPTGPVATPQG
jgi:hypothetical protein